MLLALAWLTISLPFVYSFQQAQKEAAKNHCAHSATDHQDEDNPLTNTTEEKSESGVTQLSEYLHDTGITIHGIQAQDPLHTGHQCNLHLDIHPEFFSPPPNHHIS
ncbi:MAG: hypothetical protein JWP27_384 [Flaviaesturariibacter sp.]|nr:hypothetical protein [Flaviaesturariibacter sp.]